MPASLHLETGHMLHESIGGEALVFGLGLHDPKRIAADHDTTGLADGSNRYRRSAESKWDVLRHFENIARRSDQHGHTFGEKILFRWIPAAPDIRERAVFHH